MEAYEIVKVITDAAQDILNEKRRSSRRIVRLVPLPRMSLD